MEPESSPYRFGDMLALARRSWRLAMARELEARGHRDYRVSDAASMRMLLAGPLNIQRLAAALGVTRQAARKVVRGLEERRLLTTRVNPDDQRMLEVVLTEAGTRYAQAVAEVITWLNSRLAEEVGEAALSAADRVLRSTITDPALQRTAARIPAPKAAGPATPEAGTPGSERST